MRSLRLTIVGIATGLFVGTVTLLMARAGMDISDLSVAMPMALLIAGPLSGAAAGALGAAAGCLVSRRERTVVTVLAAIAVASLAVLAGGYGNASPAPPAIYTLALLNGIIVARVLGPLCAAYGAVEGSTRS